MNLEELSKHKLPDETLLSFQYLQGLAAAAKIDWREIFIDSYVDGFWGNQHAPPRLVKEKTKINRIFFSELEAMKLAQSGLDERKTTYLQDLDEFFKERASSLKKGFIETQRAAKKRALEDHLDLATGASRDQASHLAQAAAIRRELLASQGKVPDVLGSIRQVLDDGFWKITGINRSERTVSFLSSSDIIMTHQNEDAGTNLRVNFGAFGVRVFLGDCSFRVSSSTGPHIRGYSHPHIGSDGRPCWGDAHALVSQYLMDFNFAPVFRLLHSLLTTYNDGNPYVPLSHFQAKNPQDAPPGTPIIEWCNNCDDAANECSCNPERCESCDNPQNECLCCGDCGLPDCECELCQDENCERRTIDCSAVLCEGCHQHASSCACEEEESTAQTQGAQR